MLASEIDTRIEKDQTNECVFEYSFLGITGVSMTVVPVKIFRRVDILHDGFEGENFSIAIPHDWRIVEVEKVDLEVGRFQTVMLIRPDNNAELEVEISVILSPNSTNLFEWAATFLESIGYAVIMARQTGYPVGNLVDIDATCELNGVKYFAKTLAKFTGNLGMIVQSRCNSDLYQSVGDDFTYILLSLWQGQRPLVSSDAKGR